MKLPGRQAGRKVTLLPVESYMCDDDVSNKKPRFGEEAVSAVNTSGRSALHVAARVERFGWRAIESFESFSALNSCKYLSKII